MGRLADRAKAFGRDQLDHVRHARHPLRGWKKWTLIGVQSLILFVLVFALTNLALSLSVQDRHDIGRRAWHETQALWFSALDGRDTDPAAFPAIYGDRLGTDPSADEIRTYFEDRMFDRSILLDQVMVDRMLDLNDRIDARVFPPGVYVGVRALGPDGPPMVFVTKYMAQFLFFPRHAYILVVPEDGEATVFSGSLRGHFTDDTDRPNRLAADITRFDPDAYDFPSSGQAIHELSLITQDPDFIRDAVERLDAAQDRLEDQNITYGVLAPNSNTIIGCILQEAGVMTAQQRSHWILALRAPGVGASCD